MIIAVPRREARHTVFQLGGGPEADFFYQIFNIGIGGLDIAGLLRKKFYCRVLNFFRFRSRINLLCEECRLDFVSKKLLALHAINVGFDHLGYQIL